ncbi:hypothetical protein K7A42_06685, partial [Agrobacterium sp. InxBP2]|uniref:hypothetical protein n=1 Tax=Agrobacterium sp. InxBP2 TaxID=2870329 RepID=UPI00249F8CF2
EQFGFEAHGFAFDLCAASAGGVSMLILKLPKVCVALPPSAPPGISPSRGEIGKRISLAHLNTCE